MKIFKVKLFLSCIILIAVNLIAYPQDAPQNLSSLKGIKKIGVMVEKFNTDLESKGVHEDGIRQLAWSLLQNAGLKVIPISETKNVPGAPYLYINIGAIKSTHEDLFAVSINLELRQNVILSRNKKEEYYGIPTWTNSNIGIISTDKLGQIMDYVKGEVGEFIFAYKLANDLK